MKASSAFGSIAQTPTASHIKRIYKPTREYHYRLNEALEAGLAKKIEKPTSLRLSLRNRISIKETRPFTVTFSAFTEMRHWPRAGFESVFVSIT